MDGVPVVDFGSYTLGNDTDDATVAGDQYQHHRKLDNLLSRCGLVFLTNTGIPHAKLDDLFGLSRQFFDLSTEQKMLYHFDELFRGWRGITEERHEAGKPRDLHECFNSRKHDVRTLPSDAHVAGLSERILEVTAMLEDLSTRLMRLLAAGLGIPEKTFIEYHNFNRTDNLSQMKLNFYPPIKGLECTPGQLRFGAHRDYNTFTLLFHEACGEDLQVKRSDGTFVSVTARPGDALLVAGEMLEFWTDGRIPAPVHRVVLPREDKADKVRQSMAYFVTPNPDVNVNCFGSRQKETPLTLMEYLEGRTRHLYE